MIGEVTKRERESFCPYLSFGGSTLANTDSSSDKNSCFGQSYTSCELSYIPVLVLPYCKFVM